MIADSESCIVYCSAAQGLAARGTKTNDIKIRQIGGKQVEHPHYIQPRPRGAKTSPTDFDHRTLRRLKQSPGPKGYARIGGA
jgi:hypothetical protein